MKFELLKGKSFYAVHLIFFCACHYFYWLWLDEHYETVYIHPGFQIGSKPLFPFDNLFDMKLQNIIHGEKWAFVRFTLLWFRVISFNIICFTIVWYGFSCIVTCFSGIIIMAASSYFSGFSCIYGLKQFFVIHFYWSFLVCLCRF